MTKGASQNISCISMFMAGALLAWVRETIGYTVSFEKLAIHSTKCYSTFKRRAWRFIKLDGLTVGLKSRESVHMSSARLCVK